MVQAWLTEPGSSPFYVQAVITERGDPNERIEIEMSWLAPDKWKRTIKSQEFSQMLVVNGAKVFEQDSADYVPLAIQVLTTAVIDPRPIVAALRPGDRVITKANGRSGENGRVCFDPAGKMCGMSRTGLVEVVDAPGRSVTFTDYRRFKDKRVARLRGSNPQSPFRYTRLWATRSPDRRGSAKARHEYCRPRIPVRQQVR
ncbi:MAG TPA: hypothetical protein VLR92_01870 [Blastocatellia bacterium]|nr:hypothetical protein [Blastocatellia bacterium]